MLTEWTRHLKHPKDKEEFEKYVLGSRALLNRLKDILKEKETALDRSEASLEAYDKPNWRERQAHKNGYRSCLYNIRTLIDLERAKPASTAVTTA